MSSQKNKQQSTTSKVRIALSLACCVLAFSAAVDLTLWFVYGYLVPSWTLGLMSLGSIGLIIGILALMSEPRSRG